LMQHIEGLMKINGLSENEAVPAARVNELAIMFGKDKTDIQQLLRLP